VVVNIGGHGGKAGDIVYMDFKTIVRIGKTQKVIFEKHRT